MSTGGGHPPRPCTSERLQNPAAVEAPPLYGIYVYDVRENTQRPIVVPQEGFIYTEVVSGSQRVLPVVIPDRTAGIDYPQQLQNEGVGMLSIRSVYDIDGVDTVPGGIATVRNPANPGYADAPRSFPARREGRVRIPDNDTRDFSNTAFGPNRSARHARNPGLRAGRAGRLGEGEGARKRRVLDQRAGRERPPPRRRVGRPSYQLAASAARRAR